MSVITCQSPAGQLRIPGWLGSHCQNLSLEVVPSADSELRDVAESCQLALTSWQGPCEGEVAMWA